MRRIEQLQRGISTPVRRKPTINSGNGSRNASPYSRNSSDTKKVGTPTSVTNSRAASNLYSKNTYNRNPSNGS